MKQRAPVVIAFLVFAVSGLAFAQAAPAASGSGAGVDMTGAIKTPADLYPLRVDVVKVYMHAQGYRVIYRKSGTASAELYIPVAWFTPGGKALLVKARGPQYPYMVVFYNADGSFNHVKLYVQQNVKDLTWGVIEGDPGDRFKVDSIKIEF